MSAIEEESRLALKNINYLKVNAKIEKEILNQFNRMLQNLTGEVLELKENVALIKQTAPKAMRATALITTRLHHTRNTLREISRDFKKGKLNIKFMDLFNYTIPCKERCPSEYWNVQSCFHDEIRQMLIVKYNMKLVNPSIHVMRAESFDLATKVVENGNVNLFHSNYIGPKTVLYDEHKECVTPIKSNTEEATNMILVPTEVQCDYKNFRTKDQYWTKGHCEKRDRVDPHEIIQIKHSPQYNYIYCASLNITTYNRAIPCPNEVFVLPSNQSFQIEDMRYDSQQLNLHSELHFIPEWTYRVNHMLDPHMRQKLYNNYFSKLNLSINELDSEQIDERYSYETHHKVGNVILIILIVGILVAVLIMYKSKNKKNLINKRSCVVADMNLQELEGLNIVKPQIKRTAESSKSDAKVILTME